VNIGCDSKIHLGMEVAPIVEAMVLDRAIEGGYNVIT